MEDLKTASFDERYEAANLLMQDQLYELSLPVWESLLLEKPDHANINYKYGFCVLHSNVDRKKSVKYLEIAVEEVSKNYNPFDLWELKAPIETYYYLGKAYHHAVETDKAREQFELFKTKVSKKHDLFAKADLHIIQCNNADYEIEHEHKDLIVENLGAKVNGTYSDFAPVVTLDESALFYTSRRLREDSINLKTYSPQDGKHFEDVYVSYKNPTSGEWEEPELLDQISNPRNNEATISVSPDGQILYIYRDDRGDGNIYFSRNEGDSYGSLEQIETDFDDINTPAWETHATLSVDGNTLYFVSDRDGGLGGRDIYRSVKLPNGKWSKALNLGAPINTQYDEDSPYFHPDGKTLYFASNGDKSMGGFDIFVARLQDDGFWGVPVTMGAPINTVDDDVFFVTNAAGTRGYFSSAKEDRGYGEKDIYTVELVKPMSEGVAVLKGHIIPAEGDVIPQNTYITVTNLTQGGDPQIVQVRQRDGGYVMALEPCNEYLVEYFANGEKFFDDQFEVPCEGSTYQEFGNTLNLGEIALENGYYWQIFRNGEKLIDGGIQSNYMSQYGDVVFEEPIDAGGKFAYHKVNEDIFDVKLKEGLKCENMDIVLYNDKDEELKRIKKKLGCVVGIDKPFEEGPKWKYQVLVGGEPLVDGYFADYIDLKSGGHTYHEEMTSDGVFKYHKVEDEESMLFEVWMKDPSICPNLTIQLLDENNNVVRETSQSVTCKKMTNIVANYEKFYGYNIKGIESDEKRWQKFVDDATEIVNQNGVIHVTVEGSASYVPTATWKTNTILCKKRAEDGRLAVIDVLTKAGIDESKIKIDAVNSRVQGPKYRGDFVNTEKYGPYQYLKIKAK